MKKICISTLVFVLLGFGISHSETLNQIIDNYSLTKLSNIACKFDNTKCNTSIKLSKNRYLIDNYKKIYVSILILESGNFTRKRNGYSLGYSQVNTLVWNPYILRRLGFNVTNPNDLVSNDELSIEVGLVVFYLNLIQAYQHDPNHSMIDYVSSYNSMYLPVWYRNDVLKIMSNRSLIEQALNKQF